jgi:hypothetical protein
MAILYDRIPGRRSTSIEGVHVESKLSIDRFQTYDEHLNYLTDFAQSFSSIGVTA